MILKFLCCDASADAAADVAGPTFHSQPSMRIVEAAQLLHVRHGRYKGEGTCTDSLFILLLLFAVGFLFPDYCISLNQSRAFEDPLLLLKGTLTRPRTSSQWHTPSAPKRYVLFLNESCLTDLVLTSFPGGPSTGRPLQRARTRT